MVVTENTIAVHVQASPDRLESDPLRSPGPVLNPPMRRRDTNDF
jgi:hypothetical protein